jgi:hypothetical protein
VRSSLAIGDGRRRGGARVSDRKKHLIARRIPLLDDGRLMEEDDDCARLCNDDVILLLNATQVPVAVQTPRVPSWM